MSLGHTTDHRGTIIYNDDVELARTSSDGSIIDFVRGKVNGIKLFEDVIRYIRSNILEPDEKEGHETVYVGQTKVRDPDTGNMVHLEIRKDKVTGAMVGIDGSYLENTEMPVYDPYNYGETLCIPDDEA